MEVPKDAPVYSAYTNALIGVGPLPKGIPTDAPEGHPQQGKKFHGIAFSPEKGEDGEGEYHVHRQI